MIRWSIALLLGLSTPVIANPPALDDFAYGMTLQTPGQASIYRLSLPEGVYLSAYRSDLGDLRIFNRAGQVVPHTLRRISEHKDIPRPPIPVAFYPLETVSTDTGAVSHMRVETGPEGALIVMDRQASNPAHSYISAYLVDLGGLGQSPDALSFAWTDGGDRQLLTLSIDHSADLANWDVLVSRGGLARLRNLNRSLVHDRIDLPMTAHRYLRISLPAGAQGITLTGITAHFPMGTQIKDHRQWTPLRGVRIKADRPTYQFNGGGVLPVDQINLAALPGNSLIHADILTHDKSLNTWHKRYSGDFYQLTQDNLTLENANVSLGLTQSDQWRLIINSEHADTELDGIELSLGWTPHEAYFLARGEGPYTLAYGSRAVTAATERVDTLLTRIGKRDSSQFIGQANVSETLTLGGPSRLAQVAPPTPWRQWILWGLLVLGVLLMIGMAWRLQRQLSRQA